MRWQSIATLLILCAIQAAGKSSDNPELTGSKSTSLSSVSSRLEKIKAQTTPKATASVDDSANPKGQPDSTSTQAGESDFNKGEKKNHLAEVESTSQTNVKSSVTASDQVLETKSVKLLNLTLGNADSKASASTGGDIDEAQVILPNNNEGSETAGDAGGHNNDDFKLSQSDQGSDDGTNTPISGNDEENMKITQHVTDVHDGQPHSSSHDMKLLSLPTEPVIDSQSAQASSNDNPLTETDLSAKEELDASVQGTDEPAEMEEDENSAKEKKVAFNPNAREQLKKQKERSSKDKPSVLKRQREMFEQFLDAKKVLSHTTFTYAGGQTCTWFSQGCSETAVQCHSRTLRSKRKLLEPKQKLLRCPRSTT